MALAYKTDTWKGRLTEAFKWENGEKVWNEKAKKYGMVAPILVHNKKVIRGVKNCIEYIDENFGDENFPLYPKIRRGSSKNAINLVLFFSKELFPWDFHCMLFYQDKET